MMTEPPFGPAPPLPSWLASNIRRAAVFTCLGWCVPFAAAALLFLVIALMLAYEGFDSIYPPLFWLVVFLAAMILLGREISAGLRIAFRPEKSPEIDYLRCRGDLRALASQISTELRNPANLGFGKETTVTQGWLVVSGGSRFAVRRLEDVAWVFPKIETFRLNFIIPVWRTHFVVFRSTVAPEVQAKCPPQEAARLLDHLAGRRPDILFGHTEEAERLWEADPAAFLIAARETTNPTP
jgi:hypothetical protein